MQMLIDFFSSEDFMPHGMCLLWRPEVFWLHVASDALIAISYYSIPFALLWFANRRSDLAFPWIFRLFGAFILACGTTHLMSIWVMWNPDYAVEGILKLFTAAVSLLTAILLWPLMPKAIGLPSTAQLKAVNADLAYQVGERLSAEDSLRRLNDELETRVAERTMQLEQSNRQLQSEINRREEIEKQLLQAQKMEAIGQLTGGLAHDFNNLLAVVMGNIDLLDAAIAHDPQAKRFATRAMMAAKSGADLTQKLLAFARRQSLQKSPFDLNARVRNIMDMMKHMLGETIEVELKTASDLWAVETDAIQFESTLTNLVINARDAMPSGGKLKIETANVILGHSDATSVDELRGNYVKLSITDTGVGIPADKIAHVFEPFFTTKGVGKGSGLGLSMVYGFVKQSGGHVKIESTPGQGTTVHVYLPKSHKSVPEALAQAVESEPILDGLVVLVAEDNPEVRAMLVENLISMGMVVREASNGDEAFTILEQDPNIDLLLTDMVMPGGMSGAQLAHMARGIRPQLRVILTSGFINTADHKQTDHGVRHVLPKPYRRNELIQKLLEVMSDEA